MKLHIAYPIPFQLSFWDSLSSLFMPVQLPILLSTLFLRFWYSRAMGKRKNLHLSTLFLRFYLPKRVGNRVIIPFNSLFEIQKDKKGDKTPPLDKLSTLFLRFTLQRTFSILKGIYFQLSFWDSRCESGSSHQLPLVSLSTLFLRFLWSVCLTSWKESYRLSTLFLRFIPLTSFFYGWFILSTLFLRFTPLQ